MTRSNQQVRMPGMGSPRDTTHKLAAAGWLQYAYCIHCMARCAKLGSASATTYVWLITLAVLPQEGGRVMYHTRMEELLFAMDYVAPATDETNGTEE